MLFHINEIAPSTTHAIEDKEIACVVLRMSRRGRDVSFRPNVKADEQRVEGYLILIARLEPATKSTLGNDFKGHAKMM